MKTIKVPKGEFALLFDWGKKVTITDEMLVEFIIDGMTKMVRNNLRVVEYKEPISYEDCYDDTDPNYIRSSQEEI